MRHLIYILPIFLFLACSPKTTQKLPNPTDNAPIAGVPDTMATPPSVDTALVEIVPDEDAPPYLVAVIKKTGCYGACPSFEARLFSNGHLTYRGLAEVDRIGPYEGWADENFLSQIKAAAYRLQFFELEDAYPTNARPIEELPLTITYLNLDNREKTVVNNYNSPSTLRALEQLLEELFLAVEWRELARPR